MSVPPSPEDALTGRLGTLLLKISINLYRSQIAQQRFLANKTHYLRAVDKMSILNAVGEFGVAFERSGERVKIGVVCEFQSTRNGRGNLVEYGTNHLKAEPG